MSLNKAIKHGKEKRKPYRKAKAIDCTCRNHGSCDWCKSNRTIQAQKEELRIKELAKELDKMEDDFDDNEDSYEDMLIVAMENEFEKKWGNTNE